MGALRYIFSMSITGSILFFLSLAIMPMTKKVFSSSWHYRMMIMIMVFFILPIGSFIQLPAGTYDYLPPLETIRENVMDISGTNLEVDEIPENKSSLSNPNDISGEFQKPNTIEEYTPSENTFKLNINRNMAVYIWIIGMASLFLFKTISYFKFKSMVMTDSDYIHDSQILDIFNDCKDRLKIRRNITVRLCHDISSPMLIGIFNPTILIPHTEDDEETLNMVFMHELNHYRRQDILIKSFGLMINAIHWFNPIVYIMLKKLDTFCEYSVDENVVEKMKTQDRKYYCETILNLMDESVKRRELTTSMNTNAKELKSRLENILHFKKESRKTYARSIFILMLIFISGIVISCSTAATKSEDNSFIVYTKEDGLYLRYLSGGDEIQIDEGQDISNPLISKSGDYVAYHRGYYSLFIYDIENKERRPVDYKVEPGSYDFLEDDIIVYATDKKGFMLYNAKIDAKRIYSDGYFYGNIKAAAKDIIYAKRTEKWSTSEGEFSYTVGIAEIELTGKDERVSDFPSTIIVEGRKSTGEEIGYDPTIAKISDDGKYVYIFEKPSSGSLSADGVGLGVYERSTKKYTTLMNEEDNMESGDVYGESLILAYENNMDINPKDSSSIAAIVGGDREMIHNKKMTVLNLSGDKISPMEKGLAAKTPGFTLDGTRILYSAVREIEYSDYPDGGNIYDYWIKLPHNIYEYNIETSDTKKITDGDNYDIMPIGLPKGEILFARHKGEGFFDLIRLIDSKEVVFAEDMIFHRDQRDQGYYSIGFYGHTETENAIDVFIDN